MARRKGFWFPPNGPFRYLALRDPAGTMRLWPCHVTRDHIEVNFRRHDWSGFHVDMDRLEDRVPAWVMDALRNTPNPGIIRLHREPFDSVLFHPY